MKWENGRIFRAMKLKNILLSAVSLVSVNAQALEVGAALPDLKGKNQEGKEVVIKAAAGDDFVVIFTYPKAMTPGCTAQACSVRDSFAELKKRKVTVFGLSTDSVENQKKFVAKHDLQYDLIADTDGAIAKKLGVPVQFGKFSARRALLFKGDKLIWRDDEGATKSQGEDLLKVIDGQ